MRKGVGLWVAAIIAVAVAAGAWIRVARGGWVTGPHALAWRGPDDKPIVPDRYTATPCTSMMSETMILGERVIIGCYKNAQLPAGWAWLDPKAGTAKLAWPLPVGMNWDALTGLAVRDSSTFAIALRTDVEGAAAIVIGIAGPDGWLRAPAVVTSSPGTKLGRGPLLLAMAWVNGELEAVTTHPLLDNSIDEDPFGNFQPPDVIRVPIKGAVTVTSRSIGARTRDTRANVVGALPTPRGWKIVLRSMMAETAEIVDEDGHIAPVPPPLAWWAQFGETEKSDRTALGSLWGLSSTDAEVVERDGTRTPPPAPPLPGLEPLVAFRRFELVDGILRSRRLYGPTRTETGLLVRAVGNRAIVIARGADEDLQMIGDRVDALRPLLYNSTSYGFRTAAVLPSETGYFVVSGDGEYVHVDRELRRTDERSLWHHLRTRGSVGDFIDEKRHVALMGWALFGLPIALLVGGLLAIKRGDKALVAALAVYAITAAIALALVSPLLSNV